MEKKELQRMRDEIQAFQCRRDEGYVFVSYAHRDAELVYPMVLEWIRNGCNVYIDTDFEYHTSDQNWVELMLQALTAPQCRMAVCFVSPHYAYSYASLLEVLTMRLERKRREASGERLPVDYIRLEDIQTGEMPPELREEYEGKFKQLKQRMCSFREGLRAEGGAELLASGLECVSENGAKGSGAEWTEELDNTFFPAGGGYARFYRSLAHLMAESLEPFNKNYHSPQESLTIQLQRLQSSGVAFLETEASPDAAGTQPALRYEDALFQRANAGDSVAMGELGLHYQLGDLFPEIPRDPDKAVFWLERAIGQENKRAFYYLGYLCYCGNNDEKSAILRKAQRQDVRLLANMGVTLLSEAAERSFLPAILVLCGGISEISYEVKEAQFQKYWMTLKDWPESDPNYVVVQYFLGKIRKWERSLEDAAERGCIPAMYYLAEYWSGRMKGPGKKANGPKALAWYRKAAEAEPASLSGLDRDELVLYHTGRISDTKTWRLLERDCCRWARYQMAECCGVRPGKWDFISELPDQDAAAYWTQRAQALKP